MRLSLADIEIDKGSVADPAGRVFHYDGRVFRAISAQYAPMYRKILEANFIQDVFDAGLIETWISDVELEGFELVVEHRKVPVISFWSEWCSAMIHDATETICRLNLELCKHGYITKDTHAGNVQFIDGTPYWIDFGSIISLSDQGTFLFDDFRYNSLVPLWLLSKGCHNLGRRMYQELGRTGYLKKLITRRRFRWIPPWYTLIKRKALNNNTQAALEKLLEYITGLSVRPVETFWTTGYRQGGMPPVDQPEQFNQKALAVYRLLQRLPPGTLLDIASNKGWYAELAAWMGHRVVSFDIDDASVCHLYKRVQARRLPILPLVMDFAFPTPPHGVGLQRPSALERLRSDIVLALALVHHLVFKQDFYFEPIVQIIAEYAQKHAIIEFPPKEDRHVREWFSHKHHWYSLQNFLKVLEHHFSRIEIHDSWTPPRKLIMCSK